MNKKASLDLVDFIRIIFVMVVFLFTAFLVRSTIIQKIDIIEVESKLLTYDLLLSKEINHIDKDINRIDLGTIDLEKFTSQNFEKNILDSIHYGRLNSEASAKLILRDLEGNKDYEAYYNRELYNEKKVIVEAKLTGSGAAKSLNTRFYVLIRDKDRLKKGVLNIEAILPNR